MKKLLIAAGVVGSLAVIAAAVVLFGGVGWANYDVCGVMTLEAPYDLGVDPVDEGLFGWAHYNDMTLTGHRVTEFFFFSMDQSESTNISWAGVGTSPDGPWMNITNETIQAVQFTKDLPQTVHFRSENANANQKGNLVVKIIANNEKWRYFGWQTCAKP